jgi:DNA modification methylase
MKLINNDCILAMKEMADNSVDSIVTDPPYELGFMGKSWDASGIAFNIEVWQEALRVLKPGGHLIAFSGSRTYHRMAVAIEDAGFQIRDQIMWVYGSGFPKSLDVSKAIDKAAGAEREVIGTKNAGIGTGKSYGKIVGEREEVDSTLVPITAPATPAAKQWQGWGTALKPAHEPMVLARKPIVGTVANNVLTYGVGGLNIDGSRVGSEGGTARDGKATMPNDAGWENMQGHGIAELNAGRWPANFIHDGSDEVVDLLGEPARFFYCAKASKRDRNEGLDGFEVRKINVRKGDENAIFTPNNVSARNHHPTVKPTSLMQYLVRLVTPPNGIVLDPFMGSGSTGKACAYEGFDFIGIEQSPEYVEIAKARIEFAKETLGEELDND